MEIRTALAWHLTRMPEPPPANGLALLRSGGSPPPLEVVGGNPLAHGTEIPVAAPGPSSAARVLSWSGTLADGLFDADPRTWMGAGRKAFEEFCDRIAPTLGERGWTLCFQPHARHALSDVKGCRDFLARRIGQPFEIALSPATMLERSMLPAIEEHLERMFAGLGPVAALVILEDVLDAADDDGLPRRTGLGEGLMPRDAVLSLLRTHVPAKTPIVTRAERLPSQRAWLD